MEREVYLKMHQLENRHWWFVGRRRIVRSFVERLDIPERARILEVGSGTGGNVGLLRCFGDLAALEPDPLARQLCEQSTGLRAVDGKLPDEVPFAAGSFDLVVALDAIEHMADDRMALSQIAGLLRAGGYLLCTVPAFRFLWSAHDRSHHHVERYRREELKQRLTGCGLEVECISYFNCLLFPLVASIRWIKARFGATRADDWLPPPRLNAVLTSVFSAERRYLARWAFPFGVSLIAVARKAGSAGQGAS